MDDADAQRLRGRVASGETLFFVHIPKTAGSTFVHFFRAAGPERSRFWYTPGERESFLTGQDPSLRTLAVAGGHFPLHQALDRLPGAGVFLSFVRHPVDRLVSYYRFARRSGASNSTADAARQLELPAFLRFLQRERPRILRNQQCRFLVATAREHDDLRCGFAAVEGALQRHALHLLPSDRCRAAIGLIAEAQGLPPGADIVDKKVSTGGDGARADAASEAFILEHNREDLLLFDSVLAQTTWSGDRARRS